MPQDVAPAFLELLDDDRRIAARRAGWMLFAGLALFALAWSLWSPWGLLVHLGGLAAGSALGLLLVRSVHRRHEAGLTESWKDWMGTAPECRSVPEVSRRVSGRGPVPAILWVLTALGLALVETLFVWIAVQEDASTTLAVPALVWGGLVAGSLWAYQWRAAAWRRTFAASLQEMIEDGEVTVGGA